MIWEETDLMTRSERHRLRDDRRGSVLVMALIAVMAVSVMAAGFLELARATSRRSAHSIDTKQAMYVAEAGLAEAYIGLGMAKTGNVGTQAAPAVYGNGLFWVEAVDLGNDQIQLESTAMWGVGRVTLGMVVERVETSVGALGVFSSSDIRLDPETLIDSYDSQSGTYDEQVTAGVNNHSAIFGSNGAIEINGGSNGSEVRGDVVVGPTDSLTQTGTVTISGSTSSRPMAVTLPEPIVPPIPLAAPFKLGTSPLPMILPAGEHGFDGIYMGPDSQLVVMGPGTLVVGTAELHSGANIEFDVSGGPVEVFVTQELVLNSGASFTNTLQDPTQVTVQVSPPTGNKAKNVEFNSNTEFHGTLYAPGSEVFLASGFEIFGSAIADLLVLSSGAQLHVDLAYGSFDSNLPRLTNWRVMDIPDALATNGMGPFQVLGVEKSTLVKPSLAHEDQWLMLDYVDKTGLVSNYSGMESQFDWATVAEILSGTRDGADISSVQAAPPPPGPSTPPPGLPSAWIADPSINSSDLRDYLVDASPLTPGEVNQAIERVPAMNASHLLEVLEGNQPLATGTINLLLDSPSPLSPDKIRDVLLYAPLKNGDLNTVIESTRLTDSERRDLLISNSPLNGGVLNNVLSPPMNQADYDLVMAAQ